MFKYIQKTLLKLNNSPQVFNNNIHTSKELNFNYIQVI
jgi:hypothetical protein